MQSQTIDILNQRVSVRKFTDQSVSPDLTDTILAAAFRAPTSSNIQAYSVIVVRDVDTKAELSRVTGNQKHVAEAPVFLAFCADLTRIERAMDKNGVGAAMNSNNLEMGLVASIDAALVGMSASLAAESVGLKGVMIGAVRNNALAVAELLALPSRVYCVFGMCLGWPADVPQQKPRMARTATVHHERYGLHDGAPIETDAELDQYDQSLAAHYESQNRETTPDSWSNDVAKKFSARPRENLRRELSQLGFDFS